MINSIKFVDDVIEYSTEAELEELLKLLNPDVRIIGSDWRGKNYTGYLLPITIHWHERNHSWSTSGLRERVYENEKIKLIDSDRQG
jgi:glycerol-3-phosphate cytidylyltransferase